MLIIETEVYRSGTECKDQFLKESRSGFLGGKWKLPALLEA